MGQCFFFFSLMMSFSLSWAQGSPRRDPAAFARVPQELNEKAVLKCLPRMKGFLTSRENTDLDALKTKIELVFGMQKPLIEYRELVYKNQADETWKVEFHLSYGSRWGKEQYLVKFFKTSGGVGFVEAPSPLKDTLLNKDAALRFAQHEQIESDERWERFAFPGNPRLLIKSKNFKAYDLLVEWSEARGLASKGSSSKSKLSCTILGSHPFCRCAQ